MSDKTNTRPASRQLCIRHHQVRHNKNRCDTTGTTAAHNIPGCTLPSCCKENAADRLRRWYKRERHQDHHPTPNQHIFDLSSFSTRSLLCKLVVKMTPSLPTPTPQTATRTDHHQCHLRYGSQTPKTWPADKPRIVLSAPLLHSQSHSRPTRAAKSTGKHVTMPARAHPSSTMTASANGVDQGPCAWRHVFLCNLNLSRFWVLGFRDLCTAAMKIVLYRLANNIHAVPCPVLARGRAARANINTSLCSAVKIKHVTRRSRQSRQNVHRLRVSRTDRSTLKPSSLASGKVIIGNFPSIKVSTCRLLAHCVG